VISKKNKVLLTNIPSIMDHAECLSLQSVNQPNEEYFLLNTPMLLNCQIEMVKKGGVINKRVGQDTWGPTHI